MLASLLTCELAAWPVRASAQEPAAPAPPEVHQHVAVAATLLTPTRETSGSSWSPAATPMYGIHQPWRGWDLRLDGVAIGNLISEPRDRHRTGGASERQLAGFNWGMAMARRSMAGGRFGVRTMFSAEPWTSRQCGTISFLATGEVCQGDTVHDRQQPHDLFMELGADFERPLRAGGEWRWLVYGALAGEPALGPPGFPHRASARANAIGPITHHWLDSTHVTFGLVTMGLHNQRWRTEVSAFNGRSPDQSRVDLDLGRFDSVAARVSVLPTDRLALQVSAGRLREAITDFPVPGQDSMTRVTASAMYNRPLGSDGLWATTVAFGANHARESVAGAILDATTTGVLLESSFTGSGRHTMFGRAEVGRMPAHHLHAHEFSTLVLPIGKVQVGYVRRLGTVNGMSTGLGGTFAVSVLPSELAPRYGGRTAPSFGLFFSVSAANHQM